jgi:DNA glycosylase AlkZ-like
MAPRRLTLRELNRATLARQGLLEPFAPADLATLVARSGSLQAQHPDWPAFALRARLPSSTLAPDLLEARRRREVVRASLMRITVHVVTAADVWPMSTVTLPHRVAQWRALFKLDPVTSPLGRRITAGHGAVLAGMERGPLSIREIERILTDAVGDITLPPNRCLWRHFSASVPLIHVPHDGEAYGRSRYLPTTTWLGPSAAADADPARAARHLAERYLAAFGPASAEDLAAYVGRGRNLPALRAGMEAIGDRLVRLVDEAGRTLFDLEDAPRPPGDTRVPPRLLARWDSLLLAYGTRDRTRVLAETHRSTVITANADVLPTFLVDGMVAGTWLPRRDGDGRPVADLRPFGRLAAGDRRALEREATRMLAGLAPGAFARYPGTD